MRAFSLERLLPAQTGAAAPARAATAIAIMHAASALQIPVWANANTAGVSAALAIAA